MNQTRGTPKATDGHVFLSYGHSNDSDAYVKLLAAHLSDVGVPVWSDHDIKVGEDWEEVIMAWIDACVAVIVVMTPEAQKAKGVRDEINYAKDKEKLILPLLLSGKRLLGLSNLQYEDVKKGQMPSEHLISRLVVISALGPEPSLSGERQEVARRLDLVPSMRDEAQRATLAVQLRAKFGDNVIAENPSISRIVSTFSRRPNGWCELKVIAKENSELFPPDHEAVVMLMRFLHALCTLSLRTSDGQ